MDTQLEEKYTMHSFHLTGSVMLAGICPLQKMEETQPIMSLYVLW